MNPRIRLSLTYATLMVALTAPLLSGASQSEPGVITGVVVDGATGAPLPGAVVFLTAVPARPIGSQPRQETDEKGRFAFANLPGDVTFNLSATRFGYLAGGYGRDATPADPLRAIPLASGQWMSNLRVDLWKPGSIAGFVRDENGEPVVGVVVRALPRIRLQGRDDYLAGPTARTDDRGLYRITNLAPGPYVLQVPSVQASVPTGARAQDLPPIRQLADPDDMMDVDETQRLVIGRYPLPPPPVNGRPMAYPVIFHPSTTVAADATPIVLKFGEHRANVDLTLTPVRSVRVSGTVEGPPESLQALTLRLLPIGLENLGFGSEAATAYVAADGRFTFLNVPAGSYTLDAPAQVRELTTAGAPIGPRRPLPGPPVTPIAGSSVTQIDLIPGVSLANYNHRFIGNTYTGRMPLTVGEVDLTAVVFLLRPPATMSGRVVAETDPARPDAAAVPRPALQLDPAGAEAALGRPGRAGRGGAGADQFTIAGIMPGQYLLHTSSPARGEPTGVADWLVKSVAWDGRDYTTKPFDVAGGETFDGVVVTITNILPELTGVVRGTEDLKADATMVIAFPVDPALWKNTGFAPSHVKSATVSSGNAYRFMSLPAGDFYVAAITRSIAADIWRDPAFLAKAARSASRVTLAWGRKATLDPTAAVIR